MQYFFIPEMSTYIDEEKPVTNEKLSDLTDNALEDPKLHKRIKMPVEVWNYHVINWISWTGINESCVFCRSRKKMK